MLDAQPLERPPDLRQVLPIDRLAGLGGVEIMVASIGIEREKIPTIDFKAL